MRDTLAKYIEKTKRDGIRRRKFVSIICLLSLLVAGGVFWQLRITGITMTDELCCGLEEHIHSAECPSEQRLICTLTEGEIPAPAETQSEPEADEEMPPELICGLEEHEHTADCYETETFLVCDDEHHLAECYDEEGELICASEHEHNDGCFETAETLICGLEEHSHNDECYASSPEAEEPAEAVPHYHTDACYETVYTCEFEEHIHSAECYSDHSADLEDSEDWEKHLPELTGNWAEDLSAVAQSQLGYHESVKNVEFDRLDDGSLNERGYTRYGEWYGHPYIDNWSAAFAAFCLNYADIPTEAAPVNSGCEAMLRAWQNCGIFAAADYTPLAGDLVFLDINGRGACEQIGIITSVDADGGSFTAIVGNYDDAVRDMSLSLHDSAVIGYGDLSSAYENAVKIGLGSSQNPKPPQAVTHIEGCSDECEDPACLCSCHKQKPPQTATHIEGCSDECNDPACTCSCHEQKPPQIATHIEECSDECNDPACTCPCHEQKTDAPLTEAVDLHGIIAAEASAAYQMPDLASPFLDLNDILASLTEAVSISITEKLTCADGSVWYKYLPASDDGELNAQLAEYPYLPAAAVIIDITPEEPEELSLSQSTDSGINVTVTGALPEDAALNVSKLGYNDENEFNIRDAQALLMQKIPDYNMGHFAFALDIDLDSTEELTAPVTVAVSDYILGCGDADLAVHVYHIHDDETVEEISGAVIDDDGITFQTNDFSIFYFGIEITGDWQSVLNSIAEPAYSIGPDAEYSSNENSVSFALKRSAAQAVSSTGYSLPRTGTQSAQQITDSGGTNDDGAVKVSKTIAGTELENVFDITLQVETTTNIQEFYEKPDVAIVIVMDISNTMNSDFGGVTRYDAAITAASNFIDTFAANTGSTSKLGYVAFNTDAHQIFGLSPCSNSTQAASLKSTMSTLTGNIIHNYHKDSFGNIDDHTRFTNIEAGLKMASDMLNTVDNEYKYIIFLSDGFPTTYISSGYNGYDPYCSSGTVGNDGVFHDDVLNVYCKYGTSYSDKAAIRAREMATQIKSSGAKIFSIGVNVEGQMIQTYVTQSENSKSKGFSVVDRTGPTYELGAPNDTASFKNWLRDSIGSGYYYDSTNFAGLNSAYEQIFNEIKNLHQSTSQAIWVAEDPMPIVNGQEAVEFIGFYAKDGTFVGEGPLNGTWSENGENQASFSAAKKINWDLKHSGYVSQTTGSTTTYTYSLVYRVRLQNENSVFSEGTSYDTNGTTSLTYQTIENNNGHITISDPKSVDFPIPAVKGYLADLSFLKTDSYDRPLAGAEFTLTHDDTACRGDGRNTVDLHEGTDARYTAVSDADGRVIFCNIPSGHSYILTETSVPDGYAQNGDTYKVTIAYDVLTVTVTHKDGSTENWSANGTDKIVNITSYSLPETGGSGKGFYTGAGLLIMAAALYGYKLRRDRGRRIIK